MAEIICAQANSLHLFSQLYSNPCFGFVWFPLFFFWNFFEDSVCFGIIVFVEYISGRGTEYVSRLDYIVFISGLYCARAQSCCRFIVWEQCERRYKNSVLLQKFRPFESIFKCDFSTNCLCALVCALCNQCSGINKYALLIAMSNITGKWQIEKFAHEIFNHNEMKWTEQDKSAFLFGGKNSDVVIYWLLKYQCLVCMAAAIERVQCDFHTNKQEKQIRCWFTIFFKKKY